MCALFRFPCVFGMSPFSLQQCLHRLLVDMMPCWTYAIHCIARCSVVQRCFQSVIHTPTVGVSSAKNSSPQITDCCFHSVRRYGMHECVGGVASFSFRLPVSGSYILYIYAKEDCAQSKDTMYAQVCEYRIEHLSVNKDTSPPYPPCSTLTWGIGSAFYRYGLSVFQQSSIMYTREGKVELQIKQTRPMQFMAKLKSNAMADSELDPYVVHRVVGNTVYFSVTAPARGEYGVEIYANDPASEGQTLYHVAQFLLLCLEDCHVQPLPKLPPGYLGLQPKFSELGMMTRSHHDPIVQLDCNAVTISLGCQQKVRMTANLLRVEDDKDFPEYVFSNAVGMETSFVVNVPSVGFYKLQIYGLPESEKSSELPGVFNYLINCRKLTQAVFPFPKQYAQWKDGCFMREPGVIPTARGQFASQVGFASWRVFVYMCVH